ncbi:MAG: biopolymer transporter ExbD [Planctomycetes bacterium]|nr:biopolymer transporter ExbD [Planctomycetota bacterium]
MPKRRAQPFRETQMISLADIAFLLIFFFMLSSQFMKDKVVVELPYLAAKVDQTESGHVVTMDGNGAMFLDGEPVSSPESLQGQLGVMLSGKTEAKAREIRFKCDQRLVYRQYKPVLESISAAGGVIAIMHDIKATR